MSDQSAITEQGPAGQLILVVDDEFDVLSAYTILFESLGFRVRTAGNGREALAVAAGEAPAIVVSDFMMPVMDGADFCRAWRSDPLLRGIPFILTTAGLLRKDADIPYDTLFKKPVRFEMLVDEITRLIAAAARSG